MNITEVRVKMVNDNSERLRAFCSVTFDGAFVIRDLKVIDGANGPFVAMPSRKLSDRCPRCGCKNHLRARYCNDCGSKLRENRAPRDDAGRVKLHADVAHPIHAECRQVIQDAVIAAYEEELERSQQPGYEPATDNDDGGDDYGSDYEDLVAELKETASQRGGGRSRTDEAGRDRPAPARGQDEPSQSDKRSELAGAAREDDAASPARAPAVIQDDSFGAGIL